MNIYQQFGTLSDIRHQRGATLLVALIFLTLMTLIAISAFNVSNVNLRVVRNVQLRQEAISAANSALQTTISSNNFQTATPPITVVVDLNGAGTNNYTATITPACMTYQYYTTVSSGTENCSGSIVLTGGSTSAPATICSSILWDLSSQVTELNSSTDVTVHQGVTTLGPTATAVAKC